MVSISIRICCQYLRVLVVAASILGWSAASSGGALAAARHLRFPAQCLLPVSPPPQACAPAQTETPPTAQDSAVQLEGILEDIPSPRTGRVSLRSTDQLGAQLGALDPIVDPDGGYLGVYHSPHRSRSGRRTFRISVGHSADLLHWTRLRVLDRSGASMPTLRQIPSTPGYLLAYEKVRPGGDVVRVAYYRSREDLVAGRMTASADLPRRFSSYNNGTPTILSIDWRGSPAQSVIELGFHFQTQAGGQPGADREAIGLLTGLHSWVTHKDAGADHALSVQHLRGNHGDWREFNFNGFQWRVYEGQMRFDDFATWRVVLFDVGSRTTYPLALRVDTSRVTSVGNPIATVEPAPGGSGQVLVVTAFVFAASAPGLTGELVYYQPI